MAKMNEKDARIIKEITQAAIDDLCIEFEIQRLEKEVSFGGVAKGYGVEAISTNTVIYKWEKFLRCPRLKSLVRFAGALDASLNITLEPIENAVFLVSGKQFRRTSIFNDAPSVKPGLFAPSSPTTLNAFQSAKRSFISALDRRRITLGMSVEEMRNGAKVCYTTISNLYDPSKNMNLSTMIRLAYALGCKVGLSLKPNQSMKAAA